MNNSLQQCYQTICFCLCAAQKKRKSIIYLCCLTHFPKCKKHSAGNQLFVMSQSVVICLTGQQTMDFICIYGDPKCVLCCFQCCITQGGSLGWKIKSWLQVEYCTFKRHRLNQSRASYGCLSMPIILPPHYLHWSFPVLPSTSPPTFPMADIWLVGHRTAHFAFKQEGHVWHFQPPKSAKREVTHAPVV